LNHIDGYQDGNNKMVHGMAALNIEADKKATTGLYQPKIQDIL
jgi:hypothetical protein